MGTVSWDHFFTSLNQYYVGLRQSVPHAAGGGGLTAAGYYHHGPTAPVPPGPRSITPQELDGLKAVLRLIATVVRQVRYLTTTTPSNCSEILYCNLLQQSYDVKYLTTN